MHRLLLDTHIFLWWLTDDPRLSEQTREIISDPDNEVFVSAVSGWEISIKKALGKLQAPDDLGDLLTKQGFKHLAVSFFHGEKAGSLPMHHKDPFDRMLVAQAQAEELEIVTSDEFIPLYGVRTIEAA